MPQIYFVRHGQTQNNLEGRMNSGDDDNPLNTTGEAQAKQAGEDILQKGITIDIIYSSPLSRAQNTGKIIADEIGYNGEIITDRGLREQDGGVFKGRKRDEIKQEFGIQSDEEFRKIFKQKKYNQTEDVTEFDERVLEALTEIQEQNPQKNILIVGHSGTIRPILRYIHSLDFEYAHYKMPGVGNAQVIDINKKNNFI